MDKLQAGWTAVVTFCNAHPVATKYAVCFLAGFLVAKCVF